MWQIYLDYVIKKKQVQCAELYMQIPTNTNEIPLELSIFYRGGCFFDTNSISV